jgi:hypothetical protein
MKPHMRRPVPQMDTNWTRQREQLRLAIVTTTERISRNYVVRGSFGHDDFHVTSHGLNTFSDLDLLYPDCMEPERFQRARRVEERLMSECGIRIRVSVQPADMYVTLSPSDSRFLSIGEYLRHRGEYSSDKDRSCYLLAKTTLATLRRNSDERYVATASRLASSASDRALAVKFGSANGFEVLEALLLLRRGPREAVEFANILEWAEPFEAVHRAYVQQLSLRTNIPTWLRLLVISLVENANGSGPTCP